MMIRQWNWLNLLIGLVKKHSSPPLPSSARNPANDRLEPAEGYILDFGLPRVGDRCFVVVSINSKHYSGSDNAGIL